VAKQSIQQFSTTPASNTDIAGINVNTGWPPSNVGIAYRTLMAFLADALVPLSLSITSETAVTLSPAQASAQYAVYTGALSGDCTITLPSALFVGYVQNATTGGHNIILTSGGGTTAVIAPGSAWYVYECDGAGNTELVSSLGSISPAMQPVVAAATTAIATTLLNFIASGAGAVARPVSAKLADVISPLDYGAKGDGTTDDTTAIQAAINAITTAGGGTMLWPCLPYRITRTLTVNISNFAMNMQFATLLLDDPTGLLDHIKIGNGVTQVSNVNIMDGVFTRAQVATAGYALDFSYVDNSTARGCLIFGNSRIFSGVALFECIDVYVRDNTITNCVSTGVFMEGTNSGALETNSCRVEGNLIQFCPMGINCENWVEGLYIRDNIIFACSTAGFSYGAASGTGRISVKIQQNDFDTCGTGVFVQNCTNLTINENWFSDNSGVNIQLDVGTSAATINGNQIYSSGAIHSVELHGSDVRVSGNLMSGGGACVYVKASASNISITDNDLSNATFAVNLAENPTGVNLVGNNFYGNASGALLDAGSPNARYIANNPGYNPVGVGNIAVGSSPFTYTAGSSPETIYIAGGTVSVVARGAADVFFQTNVSVALGPQESVTVTYSGVPFMAKDVA